jgi:cyclophilin family peptidyl-prolyl cis-trans isomerase
VGALRTALAPGETWHRPAHALISLARLSPADARAFLPPAVNAPLWQTRMYAARAAAALRDSSALQRLARDSVANVRDAAIAGLGPTVGHAADPVYRSALADRDYQVVLGAAQALAGTPARREAALTIQAQLARISLERRETSRDARVALLVRLRELGSPRDTASLAGYLTDFDPAVADSAAALLTTWTGRPTRASPHRLPPVAVSLAEAEALRGQRLHFTMASGGGFDVELDVDGAPATVARIARLVRKGYYNGLSWHRVAPNFVIQGGSPGANEYMGDGPFMRDELGPRSHERGSLGVSTRGRDTGDGQLFINLVDNARLDYEYTVWGRVVAGMEVVDAVLEGDVIRRVEIRPR